MCPTKDHRQFSPSTNPNPPISRIPLPSSLGSAASALPTFDVRYNSDYSPEGATSPWALDVKLTDARPTAVRLVVINGRSDQPDCVQAWPDTHPDQASIIFSKRGKFILDSPLSIGDEFTVVFSAECGDRFRILDIFTDHGDVEYRLGD